MILYKVPAADLHLEGPTVVPNMWFSIMFFSTIITCRYQQVHIILSLEVNGQSCLFPQAMTKTYHHMIHCITDKGMQEPSHHSVC